MADINEPISITDKVLKEGSGDVNKMVRLSWSRLDATPSDMPGGLLLFLLLVAFVSSVGRLESHHCLYPR